MWVLHSTAKYSPKGPKVTIPVSSGLRDSQIGNEESENDRQWIVRPSQNLMINGRSELVPPEAQCPEHSQFRSHKQSPILQPMTSGLVHIERGITRDCDVEVWSFAKNGGSYQARIRHWRYWFSGVLSAVLLLLLIACGVMNQFGTPNSSSLLVESWHCEEVLVRAGSEQPF